MGLTLVLEITECCTKSFRTVHVLLQENSIIRAAASHHNGRQCYIFNQTKKFQVPFFQGTPIGNLTNPL